MIVWRIVGNEVGPNGNGAAYFTTKREADWERRQYMSDEGNGCGNVIDPPEKIVCRNRRDLAMLLNEAMGYGAS